MKSLLHKFFFYIIIFIYLAIIVSCGDKKDYDPQHLDRGIYIYAEEPDRDPVEVKKWKKEQIIEKDEMNRYKKIDKESVGEFRRILALQKSQLGKITSLERKSTNRLNTIVGKTPNRFMRWAS